MAVGRTTLLLLDTNIDANAPVELTDADYLRLLAGAA